MKQLLHLLIYLVLILFLRGCSCKSLMNEVHQLLAEYNRHYNGMVTLEGGVYMMGISDPKARTTGEFPRRRSNVTTFQIDKFPVTNAQFWQFALAHPKYRTSAAKDMYSWVFAPSVAPGSRVASRVTPPDLWWAPVKAANWMHPEGPSSTILERLDFPAVHVSYYDAAAFCQWRTKRLPTEQEWEYAARGGLLDKPYPWGDYFKPKKMNLFQGEFPWSNSAADGFSLVSPVDAFPAQNTYGLYDLLGNVWEWTDTQYRRPGGARGGAHQVKKMTVKGGSFLERWRDSLEKEVRNSQRTGYEPTYHAQNIGFRCAKTPQAVVHENLRKEAEEAQKDAPKLHRLNETWHYQNNMVRQAVEKIVSHPTVGRREGRKALGIFRDKDEL